MKARVEGENVIIESSGGNKVTLDCVEAFELSYKIHDLAATAMNTKEERDMREIDEEEENTNWRQG